MRWGFDKILPAVLLIAVCLHAQSGRLTLEMIQDYYRAFDYGKVIELSNQALSGDYTFSGQERVKIYQMKAIAHYSQRELDAALASFIKLLEINPEFQLDPFETSPKIIDFFKQIKQSYHTPKAVEKDTVYIKPDTVHTHSVTVKFAKPQLYSTILPGTGHLAKGDILKGVLLTTLSTAALGFTISSWMECQDKEHAYLNTTDPQLIEQNYTRYNKAYKKRNTCLALYAGIWVISQLDLVLFENHETRLTAIRQNDRTAIYCRIHF